jgi:hypothetical protein
MMQQEDGENFIILIFTEPTIPHIRATKSKRMREALNLASPEEMRNA